MQTDSVIRHLEEIPGEEAVGTEKSLAELPKFQLSALRVVCALVYIFPLFYGGVHLVALQFVKLSAFLMLFLWGISSWLRMQAGIASEEQVSSRYQKRYLIFFTSLVLLGLLQILPLPLASLGWLSPTAAKLYQQAGALSGSLSIYSAFTLKSVFWISALACFGTFLLGLSFRSIRLKVRASQRPGHRSSLEKNRAVLLSRETDYVAEMLRFAVVGSALVCAVIGIIHWASGAEQLFFVFDPARPLKASARAHWPFVNPNHLAVLLEMGVMLSLARILRLNILSSFGRARKKNQQPLASVLRDPKKIFLQFSLGFGLFVMILCNILSVSRASNLLLIAGIAVLFFVSRRYTVRPPVRPVHDRRRSPAERLGRTLAQLWTRLRWPLIAFGTFLLMAFLIGQTGREMFFQRLQFGLAANENQARAHMNDATLQVIADYPVFGVGLGNWQLAAPRYSSHELSAWTLDFAHNDPLQFVAETGLFGATLGFLFILWIVLLTKKAWSALEVPAQRIELLGTSLAVLLPFLHSFVDFPFHIPALAFIFIVVLTMHLRLVVRAIARPS